MNRTRLLNIFMLVAAVIFISGTVSHGGVPQMINYQGSLTTAAGATVPNGNYNISFKLYDVPSGGASLWSENWDSSTSPITVVGGIFNVMLGFKNPIPASFFADHPVAYLGIKVGTDSEMQPRQQITSVGYAFTAGNGVPTGGIMMWSGAVNQIPAGWALCDGNNGTPNLMDKFIVGAGGGYAVGATGGEATHTLTVNEMPSHSHPISSVGDHTHSFPVYDTSSSGPYAHAATTISGKGNQTTNAAGAHTHTIDPSGGGLPHNNLPPYYALAYIMKL
ncbi:MAG: hypothetical protein HZB33_09090 [Nitrospirae bacterium]|nr:hypothetical protein [Nitrospirota bacterium]